MTTEIREVPTINYEYHYIASDGTDFTCRWECERYERRLSLKDEPVIGTAIKGFHDYYDETCPAILYDVTNEHDWQVLVERVWFGRQDIKLYPGPNQYLAIYHDGGDGESWYIIHKAKSYIEDILDEVDDYCSDLQEAIDTIICK